MADENFYSSQNWHWADKSKFLFESNSAVRATVNWLVSHFNYRYLPGCQSALLDVITHNMGDDYPEVAECSQSSLRDVRARVEGVGEILEQRLYDIATRLPRKVSRYGAYVTCC